LSALYPFLAVRDVDAAIDFYADAFGVTVSADGAEKSARG
jgi:predicted enzyme related to lactoylglutathione lyase